MPIEQMEGQSVAEPAGSPFRHRVFRNVWIASLSSNFGGVIQSVGAAWLMTSISPSAEFVALVQSASTLPIMLFSLPAGALADNFDRRKMMILAQTFLFFVAIALSVVSFSGWMTPVLLLAFTFLVGFGTAFNGPAWQSLVGEMVPRQDIPGAIALNSMGFNIARSFGPALGGTIVAIAGASMAFAVNAVSYIALIGVLMRWKPAEVRRTLPPEHLGSAMAAGMRYVAMSPNILSVLGRGAVFGIGAVALQALLPVIVRDLVDGGPLTYGLLLGGFGAGAVGGAMVSNRLRAVLSIEALTRCAFMGTGVACLATAYSQWMGVTLIALAVAGASWVLALSSFNMTVQLSSPRWVVGRAVALYQMATFGGMAGGGWIWGVLAASYDAPYALVISAVVLAFGACVGLRFPLPELQRQSLDPLDDWKQPNVAIDIQPMSGPIVITIEYTIEIKDIPAFLAIMAERKRVRRRDGARRWTLLRDLQTPTLWFERYHLPTWTDYLRHNQRMTQADIATRERLLALDHTEGRRNVHRMIERQVGWTTMDAVHGQPGLADPARHGGGGG